MNSSGPAGRARLIEAARELFAKHGVDNVSMREVTRAAEQRNTNAVQYHFRGRERLLAAAIEPQHREAAVLRNQMLDELERSGDRSPIALAEVLVLPLASQLETEAGQCYLRIMAEMVRQTERLLALRLPSSGLQRWHAMAQVAVPEHARPLDRRFSTIVFCYGEFGRWATNPGGPDGRLFVSGMVDLVTGMLVAPVTDRTRALIDQGDLATAPAPADVPVAEIRAMLS